MTRRDGVHEGSGLHVLALQPDAFGGRGGISRHGRDLLTALCEHPRVSRVVSFPRLLTEREEVLPEKLDYRKPRGGKLRYAARAVAEAALHHFDLVICTHINLLPVGWTAAKLCGAPLALVLHGIEVWEPHRSRLVGKLLPRVDAFIAVSEYTLQRMAQWFPPVAQRGFVCPNMVDDTRFMPGEPSQKLIERYGLSGKRVLLTVARLESRERYKGVDEVLEALAELREGDSRLVYLVVGDGPDRGRLERKAHDLGLAEHVVFTGWVDEDDKADHYRLADAFVLAGRKEGFGIVYLEAMACGVPVVASRLDGSIEAVRGGELGELVDPRDAADLRRGIRSALARPRRAVPEGLRLFSRAQVTQRLHELVDAVVGSVAKPNTGLTQDSGPTG